MHLYWRQPPRKNGFWRKVRASIGDTVVLFKEFRGTIAGFSIVVLAGGWLYHRLSVQAGHSAFSLAESTFLVLSMIFLQANADFPSEWYRQLFFFMMPVVGVALLARGADFGVLLFNRRLRGEAWQMAVASTYSNHVVLIGLGHLGFRVTRELFNSGLDVVVIERDPEADLLAAAQALDVPLIRADATKVDTLHAAGAERARAIIICSSNDSLNLQIALKVRSVNQNARVLVRVFDEDFAEEIQHHFGISMAFSASALAAPAIAGVATESDVSSPITLSGRTLSLARFAIGKNSSICGTTVDQFENSFDATIVLLERNGKPDLHPANTIELAHGDTISVFAEPRTLNQIARANR